MIWKSIEKLEKDLSKVLKHSHEVTDIVKCTRDLSHCENCVSLEKWKYHFESFKNLLIIVSVLEKLTLFQKTLS